MKAAVLLVRLTKNHALPDGNKRTALATMIAFCDVNGYDWLPPARGRPGRRRDLPGHARHRRSAWRGPEAVEAEVAAWIAERLHQRF